MNRSPDRTEDAALADVRRRQILDAAADVFARRGFHAASMAEIARSFGMSAGHIYNWFDSKEAIIEALVERDMANFTAFVSAARDVQDPRPLLLQQADQRANELLDPARAALQVEILAEASRNPKIAAIVRRADATVRQGLGELLAKPLQLCCKPPELAARIELLMSVFEGLLVRAVRHPELDREAYRRLLGEAVAQVLRT
jgi:TetR/AcrR family transcriptional repressor of uid operon